VDAAISQRMGLFVVGRLSDRHGIRVQLRPSGEQAGTTSLVMLPDAITHGGGGEQQPAADEFTVSQIIPEQHFQGENFSQPMRTAAELGFDDSRYTEVPDDIRELDPVGRSLMREERRAALEAQSGGQESEAPSYADDFPGQPSYDNGPNGYGEQPAAYDRQQAYEEQQQASYDEPQMPSYEEQRPAYDDTYYGPNGGLQHNDTFSSGGGYPEPSYPESAHEEPSAGGASAPESFPAFEQRRHQDDWPQQDGYRGGYSDQYAPQAESAQADDVNERDRVGFDRPGPAPTAGHALTDAGLPRRGAAASGTNGARPARQEAPAPTPDSNGDSWRSQNDERWQQASQLRKPKAGGVTSSGLPRRVPKANLVQGAAEATPQGGPQVSRAPEDVRGRLSNLRRGVQRGRSAGSETNGQATRNQHSGPDSTYNQER
jgi:hypothetical protein